MKVLRHPVFLASVFLTAANAALERTGHPLPFLHAYLDDLVCFPVVLSLALAFLRSFVTAADYRLSKAHIVLAVVYFSFLFEWLLPRISGNYTSDPLDVLAYAAGAFVFARFINTSPGSTASTITSR